MKGTFTVSDSKTLFHKDFPFVIPSLYKRIVDEMLVELNLLNNQAEFKQEKFFCIGFRETFKELTKGYEPKKNIEQLFQALCISTNFEHEKITNTANKALDEYKDKTLNEIFELIKNGTKEKVFYSRIFILGIYTVICSASDYSDDLDINKTEIIKYIISLLEIPSSRIDKDISLYKSSIKKLEQAESLLAETIKSERKKRGVK